MEQKPTLEDVVELVRNDRLRSYKVDIETDQMIESDEGAEKQRRVEMLTAMGQLLSQATPILMSPMGAALSPMIEQTTLFALRGFHVGRNIEEVVESAFAALLEQLQKPQPQQEDPAAKAKAEAAILAAQTEQKRVEIEEAEAASRIRLNEEKHQIEAMRLAKEDERADADLALKSRDADLKERSQRDDLDTRRAEQNLRARTKEDGSIETVSAMDYRDDETRMLVGQMAAAQQQQTEILAGLIQSLNTPKQVIRDENGRVVGVGPAAPSVPPAF